LPIQFTATELTESEKALQQEVREFCAENLAPGTYSPGLGMMVGISKELSLKLAERGWLGMALPVEYGGKDASVVERFVVVEELLRHGAPLDQHWTADRQSGPVIDRFGTEAQKQRFLPGICRGELCFCIGMSEPDSGSDLASVKTRAIRVEGGWQITGTKIWTTSSHNADYTIALCRSADSDDHHKGLSQFIVDLKSEGVTINRIPFIDGSAEFAEVVFEGVFVPDELLLGEEGDGWQQVTSELSFERAGPERWISPILLVEAFLREHMDSMGPEVQIFLGRAIARWWGIRQISLSVARMIDEGRAPAVESAIGKDLGTEFEQTIIADIQQLVDLEPSLNTNSEFQRLLARAILVSPSWPIRGGTNEILRGIIVRGLR
jgi:alkylation response protein AidB-like acyl-CoA dehydrogenase